MRADVRAAGFTLMEMLVVLVLAGLLAAIVVPSMERLQEGARRKTERDAIVGRLGNLAYESYVAGKSVTLPSSGSVPASDYPIELPDGWNLRVAKPINFSFNGICDGGEVTLVSPDSVTESLRLAAPSCEATAGP